MSDQRVGIVTDSACDLPPSVADALGVVIVPLTIRIDGTEYVDRRDLTPTEFWTKCAASSAPCARFIWKTSACSPRSPRWRVNWNRPLPCA
jgi:fatty acid-binding protein DegV